MIKTIYFRAFSVLMKKPLKLWGISLLSVLLTAVLTQDNITYDGNRVPLKNAKLKPCKVLKVRTADSNATYRDMRTGMTVTGAELKNGIEIGAFDPDNTGWDAKLWFFVKE